MTKFYDNGIEFSVKKKESNTIHRTYATGTRIGDMSRYVTHTAELANLELAAGRLSNARVFADEELDGTRPIIMDEPQQEPASITVDVIGDSDHIHNWTTEHVLGQRQPIARFCLDCHRMEQLQW